MQLILLNNIQSKNWKLMSLWPVSYYFWKLLATDSVLTQVMIVLISFKNCLATARLFLEEQTVHAKLAPPTIIYHLTSAMGLKTEIIFRLGPPAIIVELWEKIWDFKQNATNPSPLCSKSLTTWVAALRELNRRNFIYILCLW